jgi:hypothetical protein
MYCPKCRKPLFEPDKCRYCDWTKAEEVQPTGIYCYKCGSLIAQDSVFCVSCGAKQAINNQKPIQEKSNSYPLYYHILSWLTVGLILLIGYSQFSSKNTDIGTYKAIITCLSALIFIPQISVGSKEKPLIIYAFKWIVALCIIVFV